MKKNGLLASDMDGTVIPLEEGEERQAEIRRFGHLLAAHPEVALAYVTGRHLELGLTGVAVHGLPIPDLFVCDVGTTIYRRAGDQWQRDEAYRQELAASWGGQRGQDIGRLLGGMHGLVAQEAEKQGEFKQSYYLDRDRDTTATLAAIRGRLSDHGLTANVIYSVDSIKNIGLVDVLPPIAAKDHALAYLWRRLNLARARVVYAGDSGNDLLAFVSGFNAIIVANTAEPVKSEVRRQAVAKGIEAHTFFAAGRFVQGVMEGCFHFKLFAPRQENAG